MTKPIRLLVADDHEIILESLIKSLNEHSSIEVTGKARNGNDVLELLKKDMFDVLLLDLNMPKKNGLECMQVIQKNHPQAKVIFLTIYQEEYVIKKLVSLGAKGFLLKNVSTKKLIEAIEAVHLGDTFFDDLPSSIIEEDKDPFKVKNTLTSRELEIIRLTTEGLTGHQIGEKLFISEYTVNTHRKNILKKLNLANIAQLVAFAKSSGII